MLQLYIKYIKYNTQILAVIMFNITINNMDIKGNTFLFSAFWNAWLFLKH